MRKLNLTVLFLALSSLVCADAFAMARAANPYQRCTDRVYGEVCQQWSPNFTEAQKAAWYDCSYAHFAKCQCKYRTDLAQKAGTSCSNIDTTGV